MAVTADQVVVELQAPIAAYLRNLSTADTEFTRHMAHMEKEALDTGRAITLTGANASRSFALISAQAPQAGAAMRNASLQTGNLAAQFQDIAVTLQSGQSPLLIALQQGTQISSVLQQTANPVRALGAAFLQMVNPVSLATIAAIGLGTAAAQYFFSVLGDGRASTEVVKEQNDVIRDVAERWGEAVPALKAYVDQLDRAAASESLGEATDIAIKRQYEDLVAVVGNMRAEFTAARVDLQQLGATSQDIDAVQAAFDALEQKAREGTATAEDINAVLATIASTTDTATTPSIQGLTGVLGGLAQAFAAAASQAAIYREQAAAAQQLGPTADVFTSNQEFVAEQERINSLTSEQLALENEIARVKSTAERDEILVSDKQALEIAQGRLSAEERRAQIQKEAAAAVKAGGATAKDADRERQAVIDLIAALEHEHLLVGLTNEEKAVANALRRAGAAATDEERAQIESLISATYQEQEAIRQTNDAMREFSDASRDALGGFIDDLIAGKSATEALGNALSSIGGRLLNMGLDSLFSGAGLGSLFGIPGRAIGGPVTAGNPYKVGENGPELFVPSQSGMIVPRAPGGSAGGAQTTQINFAPVINAPNADAGGLAAVRADLRRMQAELPAQVKQVMRDTRKYGQK
jgi:hypothetical protein